MIYGENIWIFYPLLRNAIIYTLCIRSTEDTSQTTHRSCASPFWHSTTWLRARTDLGVGPPMRSLLIVLTSTMNCWHCSSPASQPADQICKLDFSAMTMVLSSRCVHVQYSVVSYTSFADQASPFSATGVQINVLVWALQMSLASIQLYFTPRSNEAVLAAMNMVPNGHRCFAEKRKRERRMVIRLPQSWNHNLYYKYLSSRKAHTWIILWEKWTSCWWPKALLAFVWMILLLMNH